MKRVQDILGKLKQYFSNIDLKVYLVCVLIATFIWLMMKMSDGYSKEIEVPIHYANYPKGMILVNKPTSSFKVQVESQGFNMMTIALRNNKQVFLDLSKIELRKTKYKRWVASIPSHLFSYEISNQLGVDPIGSKVKPDSVFLVFDSLITRELDVKLNAKLSFIEGNTLNGDLVIEPRRVQVTGPALAVRAMKFVQTDSLIMEHVGHDFEKQLKLVNNNRLVKFNPENVLVKAKVTKYSDFTSRVKLMVESDVPHLKIKTFPETVNLTYSIPIPEYNRISDSSFVVMVHIDSLDVLKGNQLIPKIVRMPDFVKSIHMDVDKVEFIILKQ